MHMYLTVIHEKDLRFYWVQNTQTVAVNTGSHTPLFGHIKIPHTLLTMGSAARRQPEFSAMHTGVL